ncbi:hypothetical protein R1sor_018425 [Riccia sorocarpa]|uniref:Uncharacterized protein n=1 Tax=Riccia sorocarpa TaxID=122646 RepID=A0ABD3I9N0_9MARC
MAHGSEPESPDGGSGSDEAETDIDRGAVEEAGLDRHDLSGNELAEVLGSYHDGRQPARKGVVFYVDCCYHLSRSGYHGMVPFINQADNRIVEMVTLTRRGANAAAISKGIELLRGRAITIAEIIHDDNSAVDSLLDGYGI